MVPCTSRRMVWLSILSWSLTSQCVHVPHRRRPWAREKTPFFLSKMCRRYAHHNAKYGYVKPTNSSLQLHYLYSTLSESCWQSVQKGSTKDYAWSSTSFIFILVRFLRRMWPFEDSVLTCEVPLTPHQLYHQKFRWLKGLWPAAAFVAI